MSPAPALLGATSHWQMVRSQMEECRKGENGLTRVFFSPSFLHVSPSFFLYAPRARKDVWKITLAQTQGGQTDDYCPDLLKKKFRLINSFNPMLVRFTPLFTQLMWRKLGDMHLKSSSLSHTYAWLSAWVRASLLCNCKGALSLAKVISNDENLAKSESENVWRQKLRKNWTE